MKYLWFMYLCCIFSWFSSSYWIDVAILEEGLDIKLISINNHYKKYLLFRKERCGLYYSKFCIILQIIGYMLSAIGFVLNLISSIFLKKEMLILVGYIWLGFAVVAAFLLISYLFYATCKTKIKEYILKK